MRAALLLLAPLALLFILLHMAWGMLAAGLLFPILPAAACDALVLFWSRIALAALGIRLQVHVAPGAVSPQVQRGALLLINHTSWADVFVIAAVTPARFVAKSEVAGWPVLGWFAGCVGTLFVERGRRHAVHHVNHTVAGRLRQRQSVGIFPEGTTTDGSCLLRFHANLVQAALQAQAPIIPVGIQYRQDGVPCTAAAFVGDMTLGGSLWRILLAPRLTAVLHWLPEVSAEGRNRQAIARVARDAIGAALNLPEVDTVAPAGETEQPVSGAPLSDPSGTA